jgi:hypothetical protein
MTRLRPALAGTTLAALLAAPAQALTIDAKALARYDLSYVQCESRYADMRGQRDEAYLAMWRLKPTTKLRTDLATARRSGIYQAERRRVLDAAAKGAAPAASSPIGHQCQALRTEARRVGAGRS